MQDEFTRLGKELKAKSGAYQDLPDEVVGQAYMKKTNPLQYELYKNQVELSKTQQSSDIQSEKELDVYKKKLEIEKKFKEENPEESAAEKKAKKAAEPIRSFVDTLEQRFMEAGGGEYEGFGARIAGTGKKLLGNIGLDDKTKSYEDARSGFAATLKSLTGDTGVLTDQDFERLSKLIPPITATPGEARQKFEDLRSQLSATLGEKSQTTYSAPESKGGAMSILFPRIKGMVDTIKNYPQALRQAGQEISQNGILAAPSADFLSKVTPNSTPEDFSGNRIINALKSGYKTVSNSQGAAGEVASVALAGQAIKGGVSSLRELLGGGRGAAAARKLAAEAVEKTGEKISGDVYVKAGKEAIKNATPDELPYLKRILAQAEEKASSGNIKPSKALDMLVKAGKKSFSKSGDPKITASGAYNQALREELRKEFTRIAPQVIDETTKISKVLGLRKGLKNTAVGLSIGAGGIAATAYLLNLLKGKGGGQSQ